MNDNRETVKFLLTLGEPIPPEKRGLSYFAFSKHAYARV